jgi:PiT family inorganic phosphate transporter
MSETLWLLVLVLVLALVFDFINGFHDAANAIATSVSTRVLRPYVAVLMAAAFNLIGALISAIVWDLITWYFALPTSSSHAILASIVGAAVAVKGVEAVIWAGIEKILLALVFSPIVGFLGAFLFITALYWLFHRAQPAQVSGLFKNLQILSAMYMALSHGSNDAQKTMGIMTMALIGASAALPAYLQPQGGQVPGG